NSPTVRLYLASALQRLAPLERLPFLDRLLSHAEDAADPNLPLMYWYALEPLADVDAARALKLAAEAKIPQLLPYMIRRLAACGKSDSLALAVSHLGQCGDTAVLQKVLLALQEGLKGRRKVSMPPCWPEVSAKLAKSSDTEVKN